MKSEVLQSCWEHIFEFFKIFEWWDCDPIKNSLMSGVDPGTGSTLLHSALMLNMNLRACEKCQMKWLQKKKQKTTTTTKNSSRGAQKIVLFQRKNSPCTSGTGGLPWIGCTREWLSGQIFHNVPKLMGTTGLTAQKVRMIPLKSKWSTVKNKGRWWN